MCVLSPVSPDSLAGEVFERTKMFIKCQLHRCDDINSVFFFSELLGNLMQFYNYHLPDKTTIGFISTIKGIN